MSVSFTEQAVLDRIKRVTRRKGWLFAKAGDRYTLCRKVMGRKPGEPLVRICDVEVMSVRREPLRLVGEPEELALEGFPDLTVTQFVGRYFHPQKVYLDDLVTRIEWRYMEDS